MSFLLSFLQNEIRNQLNIIVGEICSRCITISALDIITR